jgi:hypothetical protein
MKDDRMLPTVKLNNTRITRLIIGGNPFRGYSHFSEQLDREMIEYYTPENAVRVLLECQKNGINTMQSRGDKIIFDIIRRFRDQGGTMHWIVQTASEHPDFYQNIREIAELKPLGIYYHGTATDSRWKSGKIDTIRDHLQAIRNAGCAVGLASHMPEVLHYIEEHDWDIDFYMTCFYNLSKIERGSILAGAERVEEPFDDPDREIMCQFIRNTTKTCLAFKVLAAGRKCQSLQTVREAFQFAFDNIKPTDAMIVGVFQKHINQVEQNCVIVKDILNSAAER